MWPTSFEQFFQIATFAPKKFIFKKIPLLVKKTNQGKSKKHFCTKNIVTSVKRETITTGAKEDTFLNKISLLVKEKTKTRGSISVQKEQERKRSISKKKTTNKAENKETWTISTLP